MKSLILLLTTALCCGFPAFSASVPPDERQDVWSPAQASFEEQEQYDDVSEFGREAKESHEATDEPDTPRDDQPEVLDAVSRLFSTFVGFVEDVFVSDAVAREFSVLVGDWEEVVPTDAVSRLFSVHVGDTGLVDTSDATARLFTVCVGDLGSPETPDGIGREYTVYVGYVAAPVSDSVAREFSVYIGQDVQPQVVDAVSRVFSVYMLPPDLAVDWVSVEPPVALAGQPISVQWSVKNIGSQPVPEMWVDRVLISRDGVLDESDIVLGSFSRVAPLEPEELYTNQQAVILPSGALGNYYILVVADADDAVDEANWEANNVGSSPTTFQVTAPDLHLISLYAPADGLTDEPIEVSWSVRNVGDGAVLGTWHDRVYLSDDDVFDPEDTPVGSDVMRTGPLEPGEAYASELSFAASHLPGEYWVIVKTDARGEITEPQSGGEENTLVSNDSVVVSQTPRPNLEVTSITPPPNVNPGEVVEISWAVTNTGDAPAVGEWDESLYGSTDAQVGGDYSGPIYRYESTILPGETVVRVESFQVPAIPVGDYWVVVCLDTADEVIELDDSDNCAIEYVCVDCQQPDLVGETVGGDATAVAGEIAHVSWTVRNAGDAATEGVWWDQVCLVREGGGSPITVGAPSRADVSPVDPNTEYSLEADVQLPISLQGDYRPAIKIDVFNNLQEPGGEGNNFFESESTIQITQPDLPDLLVTSIDGPAAEGWHAGDSISLEWTVGNAGELPAEGYWIDRAYISTDAVLQPGHDQELGLFLAEGPLRAEATYTASLHNVTLPDAGTYWFLVVTDANDDVEEGADEDNVYVSGTSVVIGEPLRPDLVVGGVQGPEIGVAGDIIGVQYTVTNQGSGIAEGFWRNRTYLSIDQTCDPGEDILLEPQLTEWGPLSPGESCSYEPAPPVSIPFDVEGDYYIVVETDASNHINEGMGENNNCAATETRTTIVQPDLPNLVAENVVIPTESVEAGSVFQVSWDVRNTGPIDAEGEWTDKVYLSTTPTPSSSDRIALEGNAFVVTGPLAAGETYHASLELTLPPTPRAYYVVIVTDRYGAVEEGIGDADNVAVSATALTMVWPPRPDLIVSSILLPDPGPVGAFVDVTWTIANVGEATAQGSWNEKVYASPDAAIGGDLHLATIACEDCVLAPNEEVVRSRQLQIPDMPSGYRLIVCVDTTDAIAETHETNNCDITEENVTVLLPDLVVTDVQSPTHALADDEVTITWTVSNEGPATANGSWLDTVYLTTDGRLVPELALGSVPRVGPLHISGSYSGSCEVTVPGRIAGDHTFCVVTDVLGSIDEQGGAEGNDGCASHVTTISQPPRPDLEPTEIKEIGDGLVGQAVEVQYTLENTGPVAATGAWSDSLVAVDTTTGTKITLAELFRLGPVGSEEAQIFVESVQYPVTPGDYRLCVELDRTDLINEGLEGGEDNNELCRSDSFCVSDYNVSCKATMDGSAIRLAGQATSVDKGTLLPGVPMTLQITVRGASRTITKYATGEPILTDENGEYAYTFSPLVGEAGRYSVIARSPYSADASVDATFDIYGMRVSPRTKSETVFPGVVCQGTLTLINSGDLLLGGIKVLDEGVPDGLLLSTQLSSTALNPLGQTGDRLTLSYQLESSSGEFAPGTISLCLRSQEGATATAYINVQPRPLPVTLRAIPDALRASMFIPTGGQELRQTHVQCRVENVGSGMAHGVEVRIPSADWLSLTTPRIMPALGPNESHSVVLTLQPDEAVETGDYTGTIVLVDTNPDSSAWDVVPFTFSASSDGVGSLEVMPEDEGTYFSLDGSRHRDGAGARVAGAAITLTDPRTHRVVASGVTDDLGSVVFNELPEDTYNVEIQAPGHLPYRGLAHVQRGELQEIKPFLPIQTVTYTWIVEPIEFEDEYIFTLTAVFETTVPAPVIQVEPSFVDLTALSEETTQIDFVVTNRGLVRADDVRLAFDGSERFRIEALIEDIGDMSPTESYTIPVLITDTEFGTRLDRSLAIDPCNVTGGAHWSLYCGTLHHYGTPVRFAYPDAGCGGTDDDGDDDEMPTGDDPGDGTPGAPYVSPPPQYDWPELCAESPKQKNQECPNDDCAKSVPECCQRNVRPGPENDTNPIYLFSGEEHVETEDLRIRGRGLDVIWSRKYRSKIGPATVQGNGWDHSYNIFIEWEDPQNPSNQNLVLHDGNTRRDVYEPRPGGIWSAAGFFRELQQNEDGSFSCVFASNGRWDFNPLDESIAAGKLTAIRDRNDNAISFEYDESGRLWKIRDTLNIDGEDNRVITVGYNEDGFIEAITDFAGRVVWYEYYQEGDEDGSAGDLKSVTTPAVVGTPTGNDFPEGKTTTYTYSTGFEDDRLNHNLLTVTDGRRNDSADPTFGDGPYLVNTYSSTTNPEDRNFDRVIKQVWGGDVVDIVYVPQVPTDLNRQTVMTTIVNDRDGNVTEHDYDILNRLVAQRSYTGRAPDAALPTGETSNRPTEQIRAGDPPYYEFVYRHNDDYSPTRDTLAAGNVVQRVYEADLHENASPRIRGNLRKIIRKTGNHQVPGDQAEIVESFEYDDNMGGCCGSNFVTKHDDGLGHITRHEYDDFGNRTKTIHAEGAADEAVEEWEYNAAGQMTAHTHPDNGSGHRRRDEFVYYGPSDGHQYGYLKQEIVDAGGESLTTTYEYDAVGNVIRVTDPRGNATDYVVNALDQVVREISRPVEVYDDAGSVTGTVRYERDTHYDANNNVVRVDIQNIDETGMVVGENPQLTTTYEYEILNHVIRQTTEINEGHNAVTEYEYDGSRNRTLVRYPEATRGDQPGNVVLTLYDALDRVYREVRGTETPETSGDAPTSTTQYNYDANGNLASRIDGVEADDPHAWQYIYDSFDRLSVSVDPMGNVTRYGYDANGNRVHEIVEGELDDQPGGWGCDVLQLLEGVPPELCDMTDPTNVRLSETIYVYDERDRLTRTEIAFFDTQTQSPIGDGLAVTETHYTPNSLVWKTVDDRGNETITTFDSVNRRHVVTDAKGNGITYTYDENSNVIAVDEVDKSDLGSPDQAFTTTSAFDAHDRVVATTNNVGSVNRSYYDSRGNRVKTIDALGHEIRHAYDGLNRLINTVRDMNGDGADPAALPDGMTNPDIVTPQTWDDSSRLVGQTDDNGNTTAYVYDGLNRKIAEVYADGTQKSFTFDAHGDNIFWTDANENEVTQTFDDLGRLIRRDIVPGPGVSDDTTFEVYKYDGLGRLTWAEDDDTLVTRQYDSLSHVVRETQDLYNDPEVTWPTAIVTSVYDGVGNQTELHYPSGRIIATTYDELNRKKRITDATPAGQRLQADETDFAASDTALSATVAELHRVFTDLLPPSLFASREDSTRPKQPRLHKTGTGDRPKGGESDLIAEYWYIGPSRVERRDYGNGTRTEYIYDGITGVPNPENDFGVKHIVRTNHFRISDGMVIDDRTYAWDRMGNKTQRKDIREGGPQLTHDYTYDEVYRLVQSDKSDPDGPIETIEYVLDGVGNRTEVIGGPDAGVYTMDDMLPEPGDWQMNQYTTTPFDARQHDRNGNLTATDLGEPSEQAYAYDFANQMVGFADSAEDTTVVYAHDVLRRRFERTVKNDKSGDGECPNGRGLGSMNQHVWGMPGLAGQTQRLLTEQRMFARGPTETVRFVFNDGWQVVEEWDDAGVSYVYGPYIDEVVNLKRDDTQHYYHTDDLFSSVAITERTGVVRERYDYSDFGIPALSLEGGLPTDQKPTANHYFFTGRRWDSAPQYYRYRTRYGDQKAGVFTTRDLIGAWGDEANRGHARLYVGGNPQSRMDPLGFGAIVIPDPPKEGDECCYLGDHTYGGYDTLLTCILRKTLLPSLATLSDGITIVSVRRLGGTLVVVIRHVNGATQVLNLVIAMEECRPYCARPGMFKEAKRFHMSPRGARCWCTCVLECRPINEHKECPKECRQ